MQAIARYARPSLVVWPSRNDFPHRCLLLSSIHLSRSSSVRHRPGRIATKHRLGRLPSADILLQEGWTLLEAQGFVALPVTWRHGLRAGSYALASP